MLIREKIQNKPLFHWLFGDGDRRKMVSTAGATTPRSMTKNPYFTVVSNPPAHRFVKQHVKQIGAAAWPAI